MAQPTDKKSIVILGGSYAGISTAHYVLKHVLPSLDSSYEVLLISASTQAFCRQACPRALLSDSYFPQEKLFVNMADQFTQYPAASFRFLHGTVTALDTTTTRTVTISSPSSLTTPTTLPFHALVIATGASTPSPLLGLSATNDTSSLRAAWAAFRQALPSARTIVVSGGGPSGVEVAGELGAHLNPRTWRASLPFFTPAPPRVAITLVTSAPHLLPHLRPSIAAAAEAQLARLGVSVLKSTRVVAPTAGAGGLAEPTTVVLASGAVIEADLYVPCLGTTPNTGFVHDRAQLLAPDGRVRTNPRTLRVDVAGAGARVYAVGDASDFARPAVHSALAAVPVLGANMKRDLLGAGEGEDRGFEEETREMQLVPIGPGRGVGAVMGYRVPSWFVWLLKGRDYWLWTTARTWSGEQFVKE
ncbi:hypothetical protein B0H67DRAFT_496320 [Lasiosphaeris hirsuta]|uniref:FAD/NAD(P)-binding domain-containing protein n=1 Tax=Lasiosphaeris hirsuta TaxID=260670 RepID=A0AA40A3I4_9PEZI|nr:hypothetical protein B0H67DRAFT_496320 [Lasiosphaeris hirsuta]